MWRHAAVLVVVVACGGNREARLCKHLTKLCGEDVVPATCEKDLGDAKDALGDSYAKVVSCADEATSCPELAGCFVGGFGNALKRWGDQFERGAEKAFGDDKPGHDHHTTESHDSSAACKTFHGSAQSAKWSDCADHATHEISCKPAIDPDRQRCSCYTDGAEQWFFFAKDPPLDNRDGATRVGKANCSMGGFENL